MHTLIVLIFRETKRGGLKILFSRFYNFASYDLNNNGVITYFSGYEKRLQFWVDVSQVLEGMYEKDEIGNG